MQMWTNAMFTHPCAAWVPALIQRAIIRACAQKVIFWCQTDTVWVRICWCIYLLRYIFWYQTGTTQGRFCWCIYSKEPTVWCQTDTMLGVCIGWLTEGHLLMPDRCRRLCGSCSKFLETVVYNRLYMYFKKQQFLAISHYGFYGFQKKHRISYITITGSNCKRIKQQGMLCWYM